MTKLNRLGIWIRSLSRSEAKIWARAFANAQNLDLHGFERTAHLALGSMYPNCAGSLRQQLAHSITDRYAKLLYEAYRVGALATNPLPQETLAGDTRAPVLPANEPRMTPAGEITRVPGKVKSVDFELAPWSLATDAQNQKFFRMDPEIVPRSGPTAQTETVLDPGRAEPPMPPFEDGKHHTKCEWCFGVLDKTMFKEKNGRRVAWSRKGRYRRTHIVSTLSSLTFLLCLGSSTEETSNPTSAFPQAVLRRTARGKTGCSTWLLRTRTTGRR